MKTKVVKLCGAALSRSSKLKKEIVSAITWLDIKISEFMTNCQSKWYVGSQKAAVDLSEIIGVLKFLQMADIITKDEYSAVMKYIAG